MYALTITPLGTRRQAFPQSLFYLFWNRLSSLEQAGTGKKLEKIDKIAKKNRYARVWGKACTQVSDIHMLCTLVLVFSYIIGNYSSHLLSR